MNHRDLSESLRQQAERDADEHAKALMAAADQREREQQRLAARIDPATKAKVERPEPNPRDKFGGVHDEPTYNTRLDPISPDFDPAAWLGLD